MAKIAARLGAALVESTIGCHIAALMVTFVIGFVVVDNLDRSLPFNFVMPYATPNAAKADSWVSMTLRFDTPRKICPGDFSSFFVDSKGERFPLGTFPTIYQDMLAIDPSIRSYSKDKKIPLRAEPGPGFYESWPRYWCNLAQWFDPIKGPPVRVVVTILP